MSRTRRHIPYWAQREKRGKSVYVETWRALEGETYWTTIDPRNSTYHGFDHSADSLYLSGSGCWPEFYRGDSRRFFKRRLHKQRRLIDKKMIRKELVELGGD